MRSAAAVSDRPRQDALRDKDRHKSSPRARTAAESSPRRTFLEDGFPFRELSLVISADRRVRDPVYGVHRWWARRPPALLRGLLIASYLDAEATIEEFWRLFASAERPLTGQRVLDPFAGGGSTLVEAAGAVSLMRTSLHMRGGCALRPPIDAIRPARRSGSA